MTSEQNPNPFTAKNLSAMNPTSNTPISRMLYLRSDQADQDFGPTHKAWIMSPMYTRGKYHNLVVRSLQIPHLFPNVKEPVTLNTGTKTVTIPAGNWNPAMIARYLNDQLYPSVQMVCYDDQMMIFRFCPSVNVMNEGTTAQHVLGFRKGVDYIGAKESVLPVQLSGPRRIIVDTNLQLYNIPISGRLAVIPITEKYGDMIHYNNFASTYNHLCMDPHFQSIEIRLTDENGDLLSGYDESPWDVLISFEPIDNPGFQNFIVE
jgi:hypothetical protein